MDKLLTVIIPVYNKIAYLKQCLDSVLSQNLNKIKIVVVDDGSTDESEKICDRYKQKMTVIHQEHKGLIAATSLLYIPTAKSFKTSNSRFVRLSIFPSSLFFSIILEFNDGIRLG